MESQEGSARVKERGYLGTQGSRLKRRQGRNDGKIEKITRELKKKRSEQKRARNAEAPLSPKEGTSSLALGSRVERCWYERGKEGKRPKTGLRTGDKSGGRKLPQTWGGKKCHRIT